MQEKEGQLAYGYTTGTCAAAASAAATQMLLTQEKVSQVHWVLPGNLEWMLEVVEIECKWPHYVRCAIQKDAGDDPDVTNHVLVYAKVSRGPLRCKNQLPQVHITGGEGIGIVTSPGLDQPVGEYAINSGPRRQIREKVLALMETYGNHHDLHIEISIPEGKRLAQKTFNPRLGIRGGISVLGTTGIVEPMSEQALLNTIYVECRMHRAKGQRHLAIAPGNYGMDFMKETLQIDLNHAVKCSNFVKDTMEIVADLGFESVLFTGHLGKLVKIARGMENTHSKYGDHRMETICFYAEKYCKNREAIEKIQHCVATDEAVAILQEEGCKTEVMEEIARKVQQQMETYGRHKVKVEVILFSKVHGLLARVKE